MAPYIWTVVLSHGQNSSWAKMVRRNDPREAAGIFQGLQTGKGASLKLQSCIKFLNWWTYQPGSSYILNNASGTLLVAQLRGSGKAPFWTVQGDKNLHFHNKSTVTWVYEFVWLCSVKERIRNHFIFVLLGRHSTIAMIKTPKCLNSNFSRCSILTNDAC